MAPAVLVAREVSIEGPAGLLDHVALAVDKQVHDYSVRTVPEGLLQELRVKPGMTDALVLCHLDRLEIAAETCIRVLERPGDVAVSVTATGNAVWRTPDGAERSGEVLKLHGSGAGVTAPVSWALAALALGLIACAGSPRQYDARPGPHDRLGDVLPEEVLEVQRLRDEGQLEAARVWAGRLAQRQPQSLPLAILLQDVELELGGDARLDELRRSARLRAEREEDLPALLLAARLAQDPVRAEALLGRALELEPDSAWPSYALAHLEASAGRWGAAGQRLERALLIDPGHLWARRLETQLVARGGDRDEAVAGLERWVLEASASPFFRRRDLDAARLDLVHLQVLEERPAMAAQVLEQAAPETLGSARAQELLAAIRQARGEPRGGPRGHPCRAGGGWGRGSRARAAGGPGGGVARRPRGRARDLARRPGGRVAAQRSRRPAARAARACGDRAPRAARRAGAGGSVKVVLQRVSRAQVRVEADVVGEIGPGMLVLLGVMRGDGAQQVRRLAGKVAGLRCFPDEHGRMNRAAAEVGAAALVVSQFTLAADGRRGRRPSFDAAAPPGEAEALYEAFVRALAAAGLVTATGRFGARMEVELVNDGPVTFVLEEPPPGDPAGAAPGPDHPPPVPS